MFRQESYLFVFTLLITLLVSLPLSVHGQHAEESFDLASGYYTRSQWNESIDAFREFIRQYPNTQESDIAHFFIGEAMMQTGDFAGCFHAFQEFLSRQPNHEYSPRALFRMGEAAYRLKQFDQAVRMLESFVLTYPQHRLNEFALPYLGELRLKKSEPQLAQRAYETFLQAYPGSELQEKCRLGLAKALQLQGSTELAERIYRSMVEDPSNQLSADAQLQLGILAYGEQDFDAARQRLTVAMETCVDQESRSEACYWLARLELQEGHSTRAVELFESAAKLTMDERLATSILFDGAVAAIEGGELESADRWLRQLINTFPNSPWVDDALQLRISLAQRTGDEETAQSLIETFLRVCGESTLLPRVLEAKGRLLYKQSKFDESSEVFAQLLEFDLADIRADAELNRETWKYLQALSLISLKEAAAAETILGRIQLDGQSRDFKALVEVARATNYFSQNKFSQAIQGYENYLALEPQGSKVPRALTELAVAYCQSGKWSQADEILERLSGEYAERNALIAETTQYLAEAAFAKKQLDHAAKWYLAMTKFTHDDEVVARGLSGLAWVKIQSGEAENATAHFERLVSQFPNSEYAAEAALAYAKVLDEARNYREASEMYQFVIKRFAGTSLAQNSILRGAYTLQQVGGTKNLEAAKSLLLEYLRQPVNPTATDEATYQLGWVHYDLGQKLESLNAFKTVVQEHPHSKYWPDAAYRVVRHYVDNNDMDSATPLIKELSTIEVPKELARRIKFLEGQIAAQRQDWASVTEAMRKLVNQTDDRKLDAKANYWLSESLYRQDKFVEAGEGFQALLEKVKALDSTLAPWIYLRTAQCDCQQSKWTHALMLAESAKDQFPQFEAIHEYDFVLGRALAAKGKFDDAITAFQRVVESRSAERSETAAIAQWRIGEALFHQQKYSAAIEAYYRVDSLYQYETWRAAALMQAGKCQEHLGNWKHAAKLYQQLITRFPRSEFRASAEERLALALGQAKAVTTQDRPAHR